MVVVVVIWRGAEVRAGMVGGGRGEGAAHLRRGDRHWVRGDRTALTGGGSVGRRPPGRRPGPAASVAEARHHLSGPLWEDELLTQFHVGPAFG